MAKKRNYKTLDELDYDQLDSFLADRRSSYALEPSASDPPAVRPEERTGLVSRAKDTGIDLLKGVVDVGQSVVGLSSMTSFGLVGKGLRAVGYDPEGTHKYLDQGYSQARAESEAEVNAAQGFVGTAGSLWDNPDALAGRVVRAAPAMLGGIAGARVAAGRTYAGAKAAGATEAAATTSATKSATTWSAGLEGAQQAGGAFDRQQGDGVGIGTNYLTSIGSGLTTAAVGKLSSKFLPDVEASIATRGMSQLDLLGGGLVKRAAQGVVKEGALEELPQSSAEQLWSNVAYDRPTFEGVPEAAAEGLVVGAAAGGSFNAIAGAPRNDAEQTRREAEVLAEQERALLDAQRQSAVQEQEMRVKAARDQVRAYYAEQLPFEEFKKQRLPQIVEEQLTPEIVERAFQDELKAAVEQQLPTPSRDKFEAAFRKRVEKELGKDTEALTQEYYAELDNLIATGTDLLGDPAELNLESADEQDAEVAQVQNSDQIDLFPADEMEVPTPSPAAGSLVQAGQVTPQSTARPPSLKNIVRTEVDQALERRLITPDQHAELTNTIDQSSRPVATLANVVRKELVAAQAETSNKGKFDERLQNQTGEEGRSGQTSPLQVRPIRDSQGANDGNGQTALQEKKVGYLVPKLAPQQQAVFDFLDEVAKDGTLSDYIDSRGTWNYQRIGEATGIKRQSVLAARNQIAKKLDSANGGDVQTFLRQRTNAQRTTSEGERELTDADLGTGDDTDSARGNGYRVIAPKDESLGGFWKPTGRAVTSARDNTSINSSDDIVDDNATRKADKKANDFLYANFDPDAEVVDEVDPVAAKRQTEAEARLAEIHDAVLATPEAAEAAADWDDMRSDAEPRAKDLSRQDAYDWTLNYLEYKNGDITEAQLEEDQREIARLYRVHADASPDGNERVAGNEPSKQGQVGQTKGATGTDTEAGQAAPNAGNADGQAQTGYQADTLVDALERRKVAGDPLKIPNPETGKGRHDAIKVLAAADKRIEKLRALRKCMG